MQTVQGTLRHTDLEGGNWLLQTDAGVIYQLKGGKPSAYCDGQRVQITGRLDTKAFSIAIVGEVLEVCDCRPIP